MAVHEAGHASRCYFWNKWIMAYVSRTDEGLGLQAIEFHCPEHNVNFWFPDRAPEKKEELHEAEWLKEDHLLRAEQFLDADETAQATRELLKYLKEREPPSILRGESLSAYRKRMGWEEPGPYGSVLHDQEAEANRKPPPPLYLGEKDE